MSRCHAPPVSEAAAEGPILQRACSRGKGGGGQCSECAADEKLGLQPKLRINAPGDPFEREADRVADHVVSGRSAAAPPAISRLPSSGPVQRQVEDEEEEEIQAKQLHGGPAGTIQRQEAEEEEEEPLQMKRDGASIPSVAGPSFAQRLGSTAGSGKPLPNPVRTDFEQRMGRDLSAVRIHHGGAAAGLSREIGARAFTHGRNVYFGSGQYDPNSKTGKHLLAHELAHTVQQSGQPAAGRIQRRFVPQPGNSPVCEPPKHLKGSARRKWLRDLGNEAHDEIQKKFVKGGRNRMKELTLPFTDTSTTKESDDFVVKPTATGRPDLAIARKRRGVVKLSLGEIKPYNMVGVAAGLGVMASYETAVARNADVCRDGADSFIGLYSALVGRFCTRIGASAGQMVELDKGIGWNPGPITAKGRALAAINLGDGLIFYGCADLLKKEKKKKKKDKDKDKKKRAKKKADKAKLKETKKARKSASKSARKASREAVSEGVEKGFKKGVTRKVGTKAALKAIGKKLIPGEVYLEAAAVALALLGGAKPAFGAEGMSAEEALLEMAQHGLPPDVTISNDLARLLQENPEVLELMREAAEGTATSDEAAQAMIDLMEANKEMLDAETLEKLAKFTAESGEPELQQSAEEFRALLEKIKKGAKPSEGAEAEEDAAATGQGIDLFDDPAPETEQKEPTAGEAQKPPALELPEEVKGDERKKALLKEVVDRSDTSEFDQSQVAAFQTAIAGLSDIDLEKLLQALAALPPMEKAEDGSVPEGTEKALDVLVKMAEALKAGKALPGQQPTSAPAGAAPPPSDKDPAESSDSNALTEIEIKWAKAGISWQKEKGGKKYEIGLRFAYSKEGLAAELEQMKIRQLKAGDKKPARLGTLMAGIGYRLEDGTRVGTFGTVAVTDIVGQRLTLKINSYKSFVAADGTPVEQQVALPDLKTGFSEISKKLHDFSKDTAE